jgi:phosphoserine phosphatase
MKRCRILKGGGTLLLSDIAPNLDMGGKTAVLLDLDRTLIDTNVLFEILCQATQEVSGEKLVEELRDYNTKRMASENKPPFEPSTILGRTSAEVYEHFENILNKRSNYEPFIYGDAERLIRRAQKKGYFVGIVSFAIDKAYQESKIRAACRVLGQDLPYRITDNKNKPKVFDDMYSESEYCFVDNTGQKVTFDNLIGVGDELTDVTSTDISYTDLPNSVGILRVSPAGGSGRIPMATSFELPDNVMAVLSLDEIEF